VLLKLIVIRNEVSHLGLSSFSRAAIYGLLEALEHFPIAWNQRL
jgi:hypothetical protein